MRLDDDLCEMLMATEPEVFAEATQFKDWLVSADGGIGADTQRMFDASRSATVQIFVLPLADCL